MRKLIVNADDFGLTRGCTEGILQAWQKGVVTDTSLLVTTPHLAETVKAAQAAGMNGCGLHLTLTVGQPVLSAAVVPSVYGVEGHFATRADWRNGKQVVLAEVEAEWRAQLQRFLATGLRLNHLDSHHHVHAWLGEDVLALFGRLAKEYGVPARQIDVGSQQALQQAGVAAPDFFDGDFFDAGVSAEALLQLAERPWNGILEVMAHPAAHDEETWQISSYREKREEELTLLTDPALREAWRQAGLELVSFDAVEEAQHV